MIGTRRGIRQPLTFAAIGMASTLAYASIYAVLRDGASAQLANGIALAVTAIANTQANRRLTFGIRGTAGLVADHVAGLAALGPDPNNVIIAIAVVYTPIFARVVRGPVLAIKARDFIEAARAVGATRSRIVVRHIVPNLMSTLIVQVSLALSWAVLTEGALSFLGLSAQPPAPSWGVMLSEGRQYLEFATHLAVFPGLAIMIAVLGFNLMGDGLRDALDPQRR